MKRKLSYWLLAAEALICLALCGGEVAFPDLFPAVLAFPFAQIGMGLRALSLSGTAGDIAAWVLYVLLSLSPCAALAVCALRRKLHAEDALLPVLSTLLLGVLYAMVNPGLLASLPQGALGQPFLQALLGGIVYSVLAGYAVLLLVRHLQAADRDSLQRYMTILVWGLNALFVYMAAGACFGDFLGNLAEFRAGNTEGGSYRAITYVFLVLQYAADALPYLLDVWVGCAALELFRRQHADRYSDDTVQAAEHLAHRSARALAVTVGYGVAFNLMQLLFLKQLARVNAEIQIPVFSVAFVLASLLLAQYVRENKRLKDDNDSFI